MTYPKTKLLLVVTLLSLSACDDAKETAEELTDKSVEATTGLVDATKEGVSNAVEKVAEVVESTVDASQVLATDVVDAVTDETEAEVVAVEQTTGESSDVDVTLQEDTGVVNKLKGALDLVLEAGSDVAEKGKEVGEELLEKSDGKVEALATGAATMGAAALSKTKEVGAAVVEKTAEMVDESKEVAGAVMQKTTEVVQSASESAAEITSEAIEVTVDAGSAAAEKVKEVLSGDDSETDVVVSEVVVASNTPTSTVAVSTEMSDGNLSALVGGLETALSALAKAATQAQHAAEALKNKVAE